MFQVLPFSCLHLFVSTSIGIHSFVFSLLLVRLLFIRIHLSLSFILTSGQPITIDFFYKNEWSARHLVSIWFKKTKKNRQCESDKFSHDLINRMKWDRFSLSSSYIILFLIYCVAVSGVFFSLIIFCYVQFLFSFSNLLLSYR